MPRTKHAVLLMAAMLTVLAGTLVWLFGGSSTKTQTPTGTDVAFVDKEYVYEVAEEGGDEKKSIRESLREKLKDKVVATEPAEEEEQEDGSVVPENARMLGDGRVVRSPEEGYIVTCAQPLFEPASAPASWVREGVWYPDEKVSFGGATYYINDVSVQVGEGARIVRSNTVPPHAAGYVDLTPMQLTLQIPQNPFLSAQPSCVPSGIVGVMLNGVPLYQPLDIQGRDMVAHVSADTCGGYSANNGMYYYRSESSCLLSQVYEGAVSTLLGYALDGFGIYGSSEGGKKITNESLDACHGHTHEIPWDGTMAVMYHYHMTDEYPYSIGCFKGAPQTPVVTPLDQTTTVTPAESVDATASSTEINNVSQ